MNNTKSHNSLIKKGFSLIELIIVITIIAVLSGAAYVGIQKSRTRNMNNKVVDDLISITNALEDYKRDHFGRFPIPNPGENMNVNCYNPDATYAHDCGTAAFRQGMIDNELLSKRYLREVPTDPRTKSRYVYGISNDGQYYQVAGLYEKEDGTYEARTTENIGKGFHLPSLVRAYDGANFVLNKGAHLPYSPSHMMITGKLQNISGSVEVEDSNKKSKNENDVLVAGDTITVNSGSVDIYFSDGSITNLEDGTLIIDKEKTKVAQNDDKSIITKIKLNLTSGKIWNKVARLAKESEFNVEASGAIAGVRGTEFGFDENGNEVMVKSGSVWVKENDGTNIIGVNEKAQATKEGLENKNSMGTNDLDKYPSTKIVHLNNNMRPKVLGVEAGGVIIVENPYTTFGIDPTNKTLKINEVIAISGDQEVGRSDIVSGNIELQLLDGEHKDVRVQLMGENESLSGESKTALTIDRYTKMDLKEKFDTELIVYVPTKVKVGGSFKINTQVSGLGSEPEQKQVGEISIVTGGGKNAENTEEREKYKTSKFINPITKPKNSLNGGTFDIEINGTNSPTNGAGATETCTYNESTNTITAKETGFCTVQVSGMIENPADMTVESVESGLMMVEIVEEDGGHQQNQTPQSYTANSTYFDYTYIPGELKWKEAKAACENLGMKLPNKHNIHFQKEERGLIWDNMKEKNGLIWSSYTNYANKEGGGFEENPAGKITTVCAKDKTGEELLFAADYSDGKNGIYADYSKGEAVDMKSSKGSAIEKKGLKINQVGGEYVGYNTKGNIPSSGVIEIEVKKSELLSAGKSYFLDIVDDGGKHIELYKDSGNWIWLYIDDVPSVFTDPTASLKDIPNKSLIKIVFEWENGGSTPLFKINNISADEVNPGNKIIPNLSFTNSKFYIGSKEGGAVSNTTGSIGQPLQYPGHIKSIKIMSK